MEPVSTEGLEVTEDIGAENAEFSGCDLTEFLQGKVVELLLPLAELQSKHEKSMFQLENIKNDDYQVKLYTNFPDYDTLYQFY